MAMTADTPDPRPVPDDVCPKSGREDGKHSFVFDGDDPYLICGWCNHRRDALSGRTITDRPVSPPAELTAEERIEAILANIENNRPAGAYPHLGNRRNRLLLARNLIDAGLTLAYLRPPLDDDIALFHGHHPACPYTIEGDWSACRCGAARAAPQADAGLREALAAYRADPVNVNDNPSSWGALDALLDACDAALAADPAAPAGLDVERLSRVDIGTLVLHYGPESPSLPYAIAAEYAASQPSEDGPADEGAGG